MKTAREIVTMSICIQIGIFFVVILNIGGSGTAVSPLGAWIASNNFMTVLGISIGVIAITAVVLLAAAAFGSGVSVLGSGAGKIDVSAGMIMIGAIYGITTAFTALVLGSLPYIGVYIAIIYGLISGVAIVWDMTDRVAPTGGGR